jgi:hypothetical protein
MKIKIIDVVVSTVPTTKGSYTMAEVAYKDLTDGKVTGKKIMSFNDKKVFTAVSKAVAGQCYDVGIDKNAAGYWEWTSIYPIAAEEGDVIITDPAAKATPGAAVVARSNYETPEERKQRQDYIIRQSSVAQAVATLKTDKNIPTYEAVAELAEKYVGFVYNAMPVEEVQLEDDIPY